MRYRSNIYEFSQAARIVLAVLLMFCPVSIFASSVNTIDTVSKAKSLGDVVNRVISETESGIDLGTGTPSKNYQQLRTVVQQDSGTCPHEGTKAHTHPHAVTAVENDSCLIGSDDQYIEYNAYGKVSRIEEGDDATEFLYGPDGQRWRTLTYRNDTLIRKVIYAGDYERVTEGDSLRHFYYGEGNALCVKSGSQSNRYYYICTDNLGSIIKIVDDSGTSVFEATYDAWGRQTVTKNDIGFLRGYTGHEMMPEYGLINMNGRLYDPILGRFLSPDNYVQLPDFSLSFNRYSYCLNNPLKYVDPDGESVLLIGAILVGAYLGGSSVNGTFNPTKWNYSNWQTYAGIAIGGIAGYAGAVVGASVAASASAYGMGSIGSGVFGGIAGGAVSGAINGGGMTAIMGGSISDVFTNAAMGAGIGGLAGGISGGIGAAIGDFSGVAGSSFKNGLYELGYSAVKGAATGLASGSLMAAIEGDWSYLLQGAALGAIISVGMAGFRISLMGTTIIPPDIEGRFDADDAAMDIDSSYPVYRRGGLLKFITPGITLGRNMMVDVRYLTSDKEWYYEALAHERAHIYQQKIMGSLRFYLRTLYEYIINPGYSNNPYSNPNCLEYWADQYMRLTP